MRIVPSWLDNVLNSLVGREPLLSKRLRSKKKKRTTCVRRCNGFEPLEDRRLLAVDMGQISGTVFNDLTDNGQTGDDILVATATVRLFQDGGNGTFNNGGGDDTLVGTTTTNGTGDYTFSSLEAGTYFVQLTTPAGHIVKTGTDVQTVTITAPQAMGAAGITVDDFDSAQTISASSSGPTSANSTLDNAGILGGERDMFVEVTGGTGTATFDSDFVGTGVLNIQSSVAAIVTAHVTWDGNDNDATALDATGLGGLDLTTNAGEPITSFALDYKIDHNEQLVIFAYTSAANWSSATFNISDTSGSTESIQVDFADFVTGGGTGADFTNIGALRLQVGGGALAVDAEVALVGTVGPTVLDADFAVYEPLSLGDFVWGDVDNDGQFDAGTESGISGVVVNLFEDTNSDGSFTNGVDTLLGSDTTDGSGLYLFENLFPGEYIVQVAESNFSGGNNLNGLTSSTGNDTGGMAPDPDGNVNNDDNGTPLAGFGVVSKAITLAARSEPTNDGDADNATNLSVDFGFFAEIDLVIAKSDSPDPVIAGNTLTYTVLVTNNGPADATGVVLTDVLPAEVTFVSGTLSNGGSVAQNAGTVTGTIGNLANGASVTATIVTTVAPGTVGTINNAASVTANENETNSQNNIDIEPTVVTPNVDLVITKTDNVDPVVPGQTLIYTLNITNNGPSNATGVTVNDTLPPGVTYVSSTPSQGATSENNGVVTANLGNLAVGASASITVNVTIDSATLGTINNVAVVSANETETNPNNNTAAEPTTVNPQIDLVLTKDESADPVAPGDTFTYTLNITNNGPADATGVIVTDTLPNQVTYVSSTPSQGATSQNNGVVTANLGNLANGASATVTITVMANANANGLITNTAQVTANETETNLANNSDSEDTTLQVDPASLAGFVYVDANDDGNFDASETPLNGILITLTGTDFTGNPVSRTTTTAADGSYLFSNLLPGTYQVQETQPTFFPDGQDTVGSEGGNTTNDSFTAITLGSGENGTVYNFGELPPLLSKRDFLASSGP